MSPKFLINLEFMSREKTLTHVIVSKITTGLLLNLAIGKTVFRFFVSKKTSILWIRLNYTFLSLCDYYRGLWHECEKLKGMGKLHVFFVSNGTIKVKILENNRAKPITHAADLKKIFPDIDVDNL